jgi:histidyl-tRNA synthetase
MQALKGFRDFFPEEMAKRSYLFAAWRRVARRFGFEEYDGPPLESLELYTKKSGEEIVGQLYNFKDKGDRDVALRPEMTPTLARMMAARASTLPKPIKWFSIPQLFRYERSQRGRLREHFQLNVDIVGASEVEADAELLALGLETQRELGLTAKDVVARVNDRRIIAAALAQLEVDDGNVGAVYTAIDKFRKVSPEDFTALLEQAGVASGHIEEIRSLCDGSVGLSEWFADRGQIPEEVTQLERYLQLMGEYGLGEMVETDFSIVRGLAYYTGIVFELYDRKGKERAICGGGRYDRLIGSLGGPDTPALGFGMGDVVLSLILDGRGLLSEAPPRADVVVIPVGAELSEAARYVTTLLRSEGARVETPYSPSGVGKDLRAANRQRIPYAAIVGPEEWERKEVNLKDLRAGSQETVALNVLASKLRLRPAR